MACISEQLAKNDVCTFICRSMKPTYQYGEYMDQKCKCIDEYSYDRYTKKSQRIDLPKRRSKAESE